MDKILSYSDRLGKNKDFLLEEYQRLLETDAKNHPKAVNHEERAIKDLRKLIRTIDKTLIPSSAISFRGGVFGDSGVMDWIQMMRSQAESMYAKDKQRAIRERKTNRDGEALDGREILWKDGKQVPNSNYGYPLREDEHAYFRTIYGVVGIGEELRDIQFFRLKTSNESAINLKYPIWKPIGFRALSRDSPYQNEYVLARSRVTEFKEIDVGFNLYDLIGKCNKKIWNIDQVAEVYDIFGEEKAWEKPQLFRAEVGQIDAEPDRYDNRAFWLDNEKLFEHQDSGVKFQFRVGNIPVENVRDIIALGYVAKFKTRKGEDAYSIRGYGYCPKPGTERD